MAYVAAAVAIVGAGIAVYSEIEKGEQQAKAAERDARIKDIQAQELEFRLSRNIELVEQNYEVVRDQTILATRGQSLDVLTKLHTNTRATLERMQREGAFQARMIREGALSSSILAGEYRDAGTAGAIGAGLGGVAGASNAVGSSSRPSSTPNKTGGTTTTGSRTTTDYNMGSGSNYA